MLTVNNMTPGPAIQVCLHDIVSVKVKNKVPDQDLSIHWHGVEQMGTPYMDGVPMITQCPITYGSTYEYAFIASSPGTFFYHSDSGKSYDVNKKLEASSLLSLLVLPLSFRSAEGLQLFVHESIYFWGVFGRFS